MTPEQQQQIEQIRERQAERYKNSWWTPMRDDIDFLLSLLDSDSEAVEKDYKRLARELAMIVDVATDDDPGTALSKLHKIQHNAATRMRDKCREVVLDYFTLNAQQMIAKYGTHIPQDAIESLTLDP